MQLINKQESEENNGGKAKGQAIGRREFLSVFKCASFALVPNSENKNEAF